MTTQDTPIMVRSFNNDSDEYRANLEAYTIQELLQRYENSGQIPPRRGLKDATYKRVIINKLVNTNNIMSKFVLQNPKGVNHQMNKLLRRNNISDIQVMK